MSPQRKRVVILSSCLPIFAGAGGVLLNKHSKLLPVWIAVMVLLAVFAGVEFLKLKRTEGR